MMEELLLETIEQLYAAAVEHERWPEALHRLAHAAGGVGTVMLPFAPGIAMKTIASPDIRECADLYEREWWQRDSRNARVRARGFDRPGVMITDPMLFTAEEMARDPFYQEFLRPYDLGACAAQIIFPVPNYPVSVSVQRALRDGPFESRELRAIAVLARHAARAASITARLAAARQAETTLIGALGRLECGAVVLSAAKSALFTNQAAEGLLGDGLTMSCKGLRACHGPDQARLDGLISAALRPTIDPRDLVPIRLHRPSGKKPLLVQAVPMKPEAAGAAGSVILGLTTILLLIIDPDAEKRPNPAHALQLLGLTPAEARTAALVGSGMSPREAADELGISEGTIRIQLKQVYSKLEICRQAELAQLVARLLPLS